MFRHVTLKTRPGSMPRCKISLEIETWGTLPIGLAEAVDTSALTSGTHTITAFTVDIDKRISYPLKSSCTIDKK